MLKRVTLLLALLLAPSLTAAQSLVRPCHDVAGAPCQNMAATIASSAAESGRVLKSSAGNLVSLTVTIGATSGWLMVFEAVAVPGDGAVTPKFCRYIKSDATGGATSLAWETPLVLASGIAVAFSTTGCTTKTASATAYFTAQVQ